LFASLCVGISTFTTVSFATQNLRIIQISAPSGSEQIDTPIHMSAVLLNIGSQTIANYQVQFEISDVADQQSFFTASVSGTNLTADNTVTVTTTSSWTPTVAGTYHAHAICFDVIDSPFFFTSTFTVVIGCGISTEWHKGPAMQIVRNLDYFPKDSVLANMRPGDAIGLSCSVRDQDLLVQKCTCDGAEKTAIWGPYEDKVIYTWSIVGSGSLVQSASSEKNAVIYHIPYCIDEIAIYKHLPVIDTVFVTVSNDPASVKAGDDVMKGMYIITILYCPPSIYAEGFFPEALSVSVMVSPLRPNQDENVVTESMPACDPSTPVWDKATPLTGSTKVAVTDVPNLCPDYLVLLSADVSDNDKLTLTCVPAGNACVYPATLTPTIGDPVKYSWTLVTGKGSFPLGSNGSTVLFWKSRSSDATVRCDAVDSRTQANDDPISIFSDTIPKTKRPKAYVALGNGKNSTLAAIGDLSWTNSYFAKAADQLRVDYENAGYEVPQQNGALPGIQTALQDPCYQVFGIVAHGVVVDRKGEEVYTGDISLSDGELFNPSEIRNQSRVAFGGCRRSPFLREIDLLGCGSLRGDWAGRTHCAVIRGYDDYIRAYKILDRVKDSFPVLPPHDLSMP
jgi:hypothetical protein